MNLSSLDVNLTVSINDGLCTYYKMLRVNVENFC